MWTKDQISKYRRALASVEADREKIAVLERMAQHSPRLAADVAEIKRRAEYVTTMATIALGLDQSDDGNAAPPAK